MVLFNDILSISRFSKEKDDVMNAGDIDIDKNDDNSDISNESEKSYSKKEKKKSNFFNKYFSDISLLGARILLFNVFFFSGFTLFDDWQNTIALFKMDYELPMISYELAAHFTIISQLLFSCLILLGIFSRLAAFPFIIMAVVIEFYIDSPNSEYSSFDNYVFIVLAFIILSHGAGRISVDYLFRSGD